MDETAKSSIGNNIYKPSIRSTSSYGQRRSRSQVLKNLICISASNFLFHVGHAGVVYLQSTMNNRDGLGIVSLVVSNVAVCLSSLLLPEITMRKLGCKLTLVLSMIVQFPYIASNFYPEWETLMPTAVLGGMGSALFFSSVCTYLNILAELHNDRGDRECMASRATLFLGIFFTSISLACSTGNMISYLALENKKFNSSNITQRARSECGIEFVENANSTQKNMNLAEPDVHLRYILIGIYSCCCMASLLPILFLDPLPKDDIEHKENSIIRRLSATFRIMKKKHQLLIMPLSLYYGMQFGFYMADFNRVYTACVWGISHVGLVSMSQCISAGICSTLSGRFRKYTGRIPMCAVASLIDILGFIQHFTWLPSPEKTYMLFVFSVMRGSADGIYSAQISGLYGDLFRGEEEAAFGNFFMWAAIGRTLSFLYSNHLLITTKLYLLLSVFCLSQVGYIVLEWDIKNISRDDYIQLGNDVHLREKSKKMEENVSN